MFVLGTAGHVDHGKSTLIRRLTGIDPDRLAEEKARGLTIDLGFAWFTLPSGREAGIIDVPGHERFVHNMLAGAGQVDSVIFVVDANEGWRTQSEEHLAIIDLLGVRSGVVVLTKIDVAPGLPDITEHLRGTALDGAEIVPVSAVTGAGIDDLTAAIDRALDRTGEPRDVGRPRLFVDRSFSIKGAGTVVTGTLTGGVLRDGDDVLVLPAGTHARIRGIQTHQAAREVAHPTSRVALNLAGLDRDEIRRGDVVVRKDQWRPTRVIDIAIRPVRSLDHSLSPRSAYMLYAGTAETPARLKLIGTDFARITAAEEIVAGPGDRVVLRDTGRRATVAGGIVLDAHPLSKPNADRLAIRRERAPDELADVVVEERGVVETSDLVWLAPGAEPNNSHQLPNYVASTEWLKSTTGAIRSTLEAFHAGQALERGMLRETLRTAVKITDARLFAEVLGSITDVATDGTIVSLRSHSVNVSPEKRSGISEELAAAGFSPPPLRDLELRYGADVVKALIEAGELIRLSPGIALGRKQLEDAKRAIAAASEGERGLTASRVKELLKTSRKYAIPLLEHLDATGFTKRDGDLRTVR